MQRVHLIISGDVVGVGYRAWTVRQARELQLSGWVRNREDDTVEVIAEGFRSDLGELIKRCQHGPDIAWVEHIDVRWKKATGEFLSFEVVY